MKRLTIWAMVCFLSFGFEAFSHETHSDLMNGDVNCDGTIDVTDPIILLTHIFLGGSPPCQLPEPQYLLDEIASLQVDLDGCNVNREELSLEIQGLKLEIEFKDSNAVACARANQLLKDELSLAREEISFLRSRVLSLEVLGCTDPNATNYNADANTDDGSCHLAGCTDPDALNYDQDANFDDNSCRYINDAPGRIRIYRAVKIEPEFEHHTFNTLSFNNNNQITGYNYGPLTWDQELNTNRLALLNPSRPESHVAYHINDGGVFVGVYTDENHNERPIKWSDYNNLHTLPLPIGVNRVSIGGMNSDGEVVGSIRFSQPPNNSRAVCWLRDGTMEYINLPEEISAVGYKINNKGNLVTQYHDGTKQVFKFHRTVDSLGVDVPDLGIENLFNPVPSILDINNEGVAVGFVRYHGTNEFKNYSWDTESNEITVIETHSDYSRLDVTHINDIGQMIFGGRYLYFDGVYVSVDELIENRDDFPGKSFNVKDINDNGSILTGGFLLIPTDRFYESN